MFTMFDILQSQGDANLKAFGQQFGLSPDQTRRAMEALMPALGLGLQNQATDPMGISRMFGFGMPGATPKSAAPDMMGGMFGSPMLAQAVIQQAASASGVGSQALRQMLPIMAGMVVAGIVHLMLNPPTAPAAQPAPAAPNFGNLWADWMNGLSAAASAQTAPPAKTAPPSRPQLRREPPPSAPPQPDAAKASMEVISQMLQTGAEVQEQNVKAMREVFDAFWSQKDASAEPGKAPPEPAQAAKPPAPEATPKPTAAPGAAPSARRKPGTRG
ncbi:hypothetical protein ASG52_15065 [Methylobacterium sp. Leaf456]|uniref:DUF937 domain-containing protein n=1 Tax=Methylobacterium sp. Leaf456 TaxID=1736382 RepID=UPI0006FFF441|nr:DUF937 domain-containing protein [Methylobacterium sp. Leaf456]KQT45480.1 hypothetical protein ASG52_15065 [Methylobacterium sp. Leaf456]